MKEVLTGYSLQFWRKNLKICWYSGLLFFEVISKTNFMRVKQQNLGKV